MNEPEVQGTPGEMEANQPRLSVIICTHNPHRERLSRVLASLAEQTLDRRWWELLIVDNCSNPAVARHVEVPHGIPECRYIEEPALGLTNARLTGIREARTELLVFVDDDNVLDRNYLEEALKLFAREPQVGVAGGIIAGEYEIRPPVWAEGYLNLLGVRDFGPRPMRALVYNYVGPWEPIGAGMVIRANVAQRYAKLARDPTRRSLDRRGAGLDSCGDTDMARCAPDLGYYLAYEPNLRMTHLIPAFRLRFTYLLDLCCSLKRSGILLDRIRSGQPVAIASPMRRVLKFILEAVRRLTPSPRRWLLEMATVYGELQARAIPDEAISSASDL